MTQNCVTVSLSPTDPTAIEKRMVNFLSSAELSPTLDGEPAAEVAELTDEEVFNLRDSHVLLFDDQSEAGSHYTWTPPPVYCIYKSVYTYTVYTLYISRRAPAVNINGITD